jgi:hypothetical protein
MSSNSRYQPIPKQTRKIKPTRRSVSGVYAFRGETSIPYESTLERDFIIRHEFDLDVSEIIPQPVVIPFKTRSGRTYSYTPDFLVYRSLGLATYSRYPKPVLVEVKPYTEWKKNWREWSAKWKAARRFAREQGWEFRIYDESRIRDEVLKNIMFLSRYQRLEFSNEDSIHIIESVRERGAVEFHALLARHFMGIYRATGISHIWHLVATNQLKCDLSIPLSDFSELWVN